MGGDIHVEVRRVWCKHQKCFALQLPVEHPLNPPRILLNYRKKKIQFQIQATVMNKIMYFKK